MVPYPPTHALFADGFLLGKTACQLLMEKGFYSRESLASEREHYREYLDDIDWVNDIRRDCGAHPPIVPCTFPTFRHVIGLRRIVQDRLAVAKRRASDRHLANGLWSASLNSDLNPT